MADLHSTVPDSDLTWNANQMATLLFAELFTLHRVSFRFPSQLLSREMGLESGSESASTSVNVNKSQESKIEFFAENPILSDLAILCRLMLKN